MQTITRTLSIVRAAAGPGLIAALLLVGGCASPPPTPPDDALVAARTAIANAERADATRHAGRELGSARELLTRADRAVTDVDMPTARRFAELSRADAELALARTEAAKAAVINREMQLGVDALSDELHRKETPQ